MVEILGREASPAVTAALPVRDGASTLARSIESIRAQTFTDWELLVIDDGSGDASAEIAASFSDSRIRVLSDSRKRGLAARLNEGIDMARGRYFARMDADDIAYPERFARQVAFLDRHSDVDLLGTRALVFRGEGEAVAMFPFRATHREICARPWSGFYLPHPTWMGRIEWFRRFRYRVPEVVRAEDQDLLLRSFDSSTFACLPEVLLGYRVEATALRKLLGVRVSLARAEVSVNLKAARPIYALLGAATFLGKAALDAATFALGANTTVRYHAGLIPEAEAARWRAVWKSVHATAATPVPIQ